MLFYVRVCCVRVCCVRVCMISYPRSLLGLWLACVCVRACVYGCMGACVRLCVGVCNCLRARCILLNYIFYSRCCLFAQMECSRRVSAGSFLALEGSRAKNFKKTIKDRQPFSFAEKSNSIFILNRSYMQSIQKKFQQIKFVSNLRIGYNYLHDSQLFSFRICIERIYRRRNVSVSKRHPAVASRRRRYLPLS